MFLNALREGGAANAARRLMEGVRAKRIDTRMLVQDKSGDDPLIIGAGTKTEMMMGFVKPRLEWLCVELYALRKCSFSPAVMPDRLPSKAARFEPDIVHLHWVTNGFLRIETIKRFNRPLVWTLHDSWAFTGGCHVPGQCERYRQCCGRCPVLFSSRENDMSRWVWKRKRRAWNTLDLTVVTPSRWLGKCAQASSLFRDARVEVIPNGLNLQSYKPGEKRFAREAFSLPQEKRLILFGGNKCMIDKNKGFHILSDTLRVLAEKGWRDTAEVVVFGSSKPKRPPNLGLKTHYLGWLPDDISISRLNASADVCVVPSIQENLSYTAMESIACGTPCVAFDQGGNSDVIEHGINGYLAKPYDVSDLAHGLDWVLGDDERRRNLSIQARLKAEQEFAMEKVAERYVELYREILDGACVTNKHWRPN